MFTVQFRTNHDIIIIRNNFTDTLVHRFVNRNARIIAYRILYQNPRNLSEGVWGKWIQVPGR